MRIFQAEPFCATEPFALEFVLIVDMFELAILDQLSTGSIAFLDDSVATLAESMGNLHLLNVSARVAHGFACSFET